MKKKITIIYDFLKELGGIERVIFFQENCLRKDYDVNLLFTYFSKKESKKIIETFSKIKNVKINYFGDKLEILQYFLSLCFPRRIYKFTPDLFITHSFISHRMAYKNKLKNKIPYIAYIHHPPNFLYGRNIKWANNFPRFIAYVVGLLGSTILKKMDKIAVKNANLVLVNSKYTANRIKRIYNVKPIIIYPPVSSEFKVINVNKVKKIINKLGIKKEYILLHGRIIKDKRPDLAIKSFAIVVNKYKKDILLVISGTIEERKKIEKLIKELKIKDRIKIIGKVSKEELIALYNCARCFLMSAPKEDFGLTTVEAISCGCPVVGWSDNAGTQEIIKENINGFLAKPYDINDYANKIIRCLEKNWNKKKVSLSVRKFSEKEIKKRLLRIIRRII